MARPTNVEPKAGEVSGDKENNAQVQAEGKQEPSDQEAARKDAGESTSPIEAATNADPLPSEDTEKKNTSVTTVTSEDVQEESASVAKGSNDTTGEAKQEKAQKDGGSASDNDTGERPVREKLRETSIAGIHNAQAEPASSPDDTSMASQKSPSAADEASDSSSVNGRARSTKKRSIDDVQPGDEHGDSNSDEEMAHRRKRSRESTPGDSAHVEENHVEFDSKAADEDDTPEKSSTTETKTKSNNKATADDSAAPDESALEKLKSPKKKRSRDQFDNDLKEELSVEQNQEGKIAGQDASASSEIPSDNAKKDKGEPEKKRHRDNSQERETKAESDLSTSKIPPSNAFSNSSAISPFASLASSKSPAESEKTNQATSSSAFASSSLAAFAGSDKSPFSSIAGSAPSSSAFGSAAPADSKKTEPSGFAGAASSGASPFASTGASGFGKLGSGSGFAGSSFGGGFAAAAKPGGGLTSFAAPTGSGVLGSGSSKAKPFGAPPDGDEEEEDDEKPGFEGLEEEKEDERFFKQDTETGEEDEETQFTCKAKLFHFDAKEWKERGLGTFKLNVTKGSEEDSKISSARLIMRADGALRVILNTPVFKGMTVGDASGKEPTAKQVHLASLENGRSVPLLLRTGSNDLAKELYNKIESLKKIL